MNNTYWLWLGSDVLALKTVDIVGNPEPEKKICWHF